jgi:predicted RNA-binding protein with PUA-like domain
VARWLFKTEPSTYGYADLERDGETVWDGVANPVALKNLGQVLPGDTILCYHTGKEKAIVGELIATATTPPPAKGESPIVRVKVVRRWPQPITLAQLKADKAFAGWELLRLPRLSIMPVGDAHWQRLCQLAGI